MIVNFIETWVPIVAYHATVKHLSALDEMHGVDLWLAKVKA
jgi:hypothetical protein